MGKKKKRRNLLISAGIIPARSAKQKSGAQLRQTYRRAKPTRELILHKAEALGLLEVVEVRDPDTGQVTGTRRQPSKKLDWNTSVEPLDILLHRGRGRARSNDLFISEQEHVAAMRLGYLRHAVLGRRGPSMCRYAIAEELSSDHAPDRAMTDEEKAEAAEVAHDRWFEAMGYLKERAPLAIGPLHTLLDGEWPRDVQVRRAIKGLEVLVRIWRIV